MKCVIVQSLQTPSLKHRSFYVINITTLKIDEKSGKSRKNGICQGNHGSHFSDHYSGPPLIRPSLVNDKRGHILAAGEGQL